VRHRSACSLSRTEWESGPDIEDRIFSRRDVNGQQTAFIIAEPSGPWRFLPTAAMPSPVATIARSAFGRSLPQLRSSVTPRDRRP
jgi:hypothetical protein